jgi:hypothetical protein
MQSTNQIRLSAAVLAALLAASASTVLASPELVWVSSQSQNTVRSYQLGSGWTGNEIAVSSPRCVRFGPSGKLYIGSYLGDTIYEQASGGLTPFMLVRRPRGFDFDAGGNLFAVADSRVVLRRGTDGSVSYVGSWFPSDDASIGPDNSGDSVPDLYLASAGETDPQIRMFSGAGGGGGGGFPPPGSPPTRFLLVDDRFVESMQGARRVVHRLRPYEGNPIIVQDRDWECHPEFRYYPSVVMWANSVLRDPQTGRFRMWYTGFNDLDEQRRETGLLLLAESEDGINWTKPDLGIIQWKGSSRNNIVVVGPVDENGGPNRHFDTPNIIYRPEEPDPKNRYRLLAWAFSGIFEGDHNKGVWLYRSADGLHWELVKRDAIPNAQEFNSFFWDPRQGKFIGLVRMRGIWPRTVGYTESLDFLNWTPAQTILEPRHLNTRYNLPGDDVYGLCGFPYESHYIGFLHTHHTDRRLEVQLMSSPDGRNWSFVGEGEYVLPNDPRGGYGQGMMSTMSGPPIRMGDELWVYIGISPCAHSTNQEIQNGPGQQKRVIGLARLRLDGFASIESVEEWAELVTRPLQVTGSRLCVNARIDHKGELRAALLDESGQALPGFGLADCAPLTAGGTRLELNWSGGTPPSGRQLKVQFRFRNTGIYSFWWE